VKRQQTILIFLIICMNASEWVSNILTLNEWISMSISKLLLDNLSFQAKSSFQLCSCLFNIKMYYPHNTHAIDEYWVRVRQIASAFCVNVSTPTIEQLKHNSMSTTASVSGCCAPTCSCCCRRQCSNIMCVM